MAVSLLFRFFGRSHANQGLLLLHSVLLLLCAIVELVDIGGKDMLALGRGQVLVQLRLLFKLLHVSDALLFSGLLWILTGCEGVLQGTHRIVTLKLLAVSLLLEFAGNVLQ